MTRCVAAPVALETFLSNYVASLDPMDTIDHEATPAAATERVCRVRFVPGRVALAVDLSDRRLPCSSARSSGGDRDAARRGRTLRLARSGPAPSARKNTTSLGAGG